MKITVQRKSLGRTRKLSIVEYELPREPTTLRDVLEMLVALEIEQYSVGESLVQFLTEAQQDTLVDTGVAKFSPLAPRREMDISQGIEVMRLAFEDGLFKVIQGEHVYTALDEQVREGSLKWIFIKLTFLTGR